MFRLGLILTALALITIGSTQLRQIRPYPKWMAAILSPLPTDTAVAPGGNIQAAWNNAQCGDRIIFQAKGVYETPALFVPNSLTAKACTAAQPITFTSSVPAPPRGTRVTKADRDNNMPKLVVKGGSAFFEARAGLGHVRFSNLWFTNKEGQTTTLLLSNNGEDITHPDPRDPQVNWPHDIEVDHCFFNPVEWDMYPEANLCSSVNTAVGMVGINVTVRDSVMKGFGARYGSGVGADQPQCGSVLLDGESVIVGTAPGPMLIDNNQMEEWFVAFFIGGGDPGSMFGGKVLSSPAPTLTSATLDTVNGLQVGMGIAFEMNVASPTFGGITVADGIITSISGNSVTFTHLVGKWGKTDNYIPIPDGAARPKTVDDVGGVAPCSLNYLDAPAWCSRAYWGGYNPSNITITHNYVNKPTRWYKILNSNGKSIGDGKGFFEIKLCDGCLIDGNIFDGNTGFTITVRNQGGRAPWSAIRNLTMTNNLATRFSAGFYTLFFDNEQLSTESSNITFENNLMYGEFDNTDQSGFRPQVFRGTYGDRVSIRHNTILQSGRIMSYGNSADQAGIDELTNFVFKDNIVGWGTGTQSGYACFDGPLNVCTPNYIWTNNAMIGAPTGPLPPGEQSMASFPPGNFNPATITDVGFVDPASGNYRLREDSPLKRKASDGKDVGVDMDQLLAHLNGPIPVPTPTPTPTPISTPTPSPTPVGSPTPLPSPSPLVEIVSSANVREGPSIESAEKFIAQPGDRGTKGTCQQDLKSSNVYCLVSFLNSTNGYVAQQFLKLVESPTPTPTPTPSPSPSPSPTVTPTPTPSPTPVSCTMTVSSPTLQQWSSGKLVVTFTGLTQTSTVTATATSGQVSVTPTLKAVNGTSVIAEFLLTAKKKSSSVVVAGPCGSKTVLINVQ